MDARKLEIIEDLPLSASDLVYLILVVLGAKPAAWLQARSGVWREGDPEKEFPEVLRQTIEAALTELGIAFHIETLTTHAGLDQPQQGRRRFHVLMHILVGKDDEHLQKLLTAREAKDNKAIGRALGYPSTAIDAFMTDDRLFVEDLPLKVQLSEAAQFIQFVLSKQHWRGELAAVEAWAQLVKKTSPIVYFAYLHSSANIEPGLAERLLPLVHKEGVR